MIERQTDSSSARHCCHVPAHMFPPIPRSGPRMVIRRLSIFAIAFLTAVFTNGLHASPVDHAADPILMADDPALSPDGSQLVFSWMGEIWKSKIDGTDLVRLTHHSSSDKQPRFSPDGSQIAFVSDRTGASQIFVMNSLGSVPKQVTHHTEGYSLEDWFPDGKSLLATGVRDHFHRDATRLIKVSLDERRADVILADAMAKDASLSPNGKQILLTREGERWWRKGYSGERSAQVWLLDLESGDFKELLHEGVECMWPMWMANGKGFYFSKGTAHGFDLYRYRFPGKDETEGKQKKVLSFDDDSIVFPAISSDGSTIVFRHLFELYVFHPGKDKLPTKIEFRLDADTELPRDELRREYTKADQVAFSADGLEIAILAGGDVWVMDTKLREPQRVTLMPGFEENVVFSNDGNELWFTSTKDGQTDIWKATRRDGERFWWQNTEFNVEQVTNDPHVESKLRFTPDGKQLVFQQGRGDLAVMELETQERRVLLRGFSGIDFDLSYDSRWIAYSQQDNDFNHEIWIASLSGEANPVNVSRHPDNDDGPKFSPDGKLLAFTGRRFDREVDVYYVYLQEALHEETSRQRRIEEALELMTKKRSAKGSPAATKPAAVSDAKSEEKPDNPLEDEASDDVAKDDEEKELAEKKASAEIKPMKIDFDRIHERVRRISIADSNESELVFSPDSKKLAFAGTIDGKRGWYTVEFPDELNPKLLTTTTGSDPVWSDKAGGILFSRSGVPAKVDKSDKLETYEFKVAQLSTRSQWLKSGFEKAWLTMREVWYDESFANRNWDDVRRKYVDAASRVMDTHAMASLVQLMLGELNGSHLGFTPSGSHSGAEVEGWNDSTAHLGVRFVEDHPGPGLMVRDVIPGGPGDREFCKLLAGDRIISIDGTPVDPAMDLTRVLNGRLDRDIVLSVSRLTEGTNDTEELELSLRPISFSAARTLLYDQWLQRNRQTVDKASGGRLGYLHIRGMDMTSFYEFERQLYNVGYGREGLVIDVRDNGGGSTTDLLLTALTQPRHAITVPRGGGPGYPHDRLVFASWSKPIIVLCNQNSYSNAEIFSHAVKTLKRGKVVGVQTAGGVVSTGSARINDVGTIRVPFRGWFTIGTGDDMEMNGCLPDEVIWPGPGEMPQGIDRQLDRAVEILLDEVGDGLIDQELKYATQRTASDSKSKK